MSTEVDTPADPGPELRIAIPAPPSAIVGAHSDPPRPRTANSSAGGSVPGKPEAPIIVPQLTAEEAAAAQQQTNRNLGVAEKNLAATQGKNLNAAQTDLASKVRSFIAEAREAARVSDWIRAKDLAIKAQVLSQELVNSL